MDADSVAARAALLRRYWVFTGFALLCAGLGFALLRAAWGIAPAWQWLAQAAAALLYLLVVFYRGLPYNRRMQETPPALKPRLLPTLGPGNLLTLLRGVLIAALIGFLFLPRPDGLLAWIPGIIYTLACAADFLDGWAARASNHATRLGELLDMSFDGVGVLAAALLAVQYGQVPPWYLVVALSRYLFLGGLWVVRRLERPVYELPPSLSRRGFAGLQMGLLAVMLWPVFTPPGTHIAAALFALPFLVGFSRDFLIAAGVMRVRPAAEASPLRRLAGEWGPPALRLLAGALALPRLSALLNGAAQASPFLIALELLVWLCILSGAAVRVMAIAGLLLLGAQQNLADLALPQSVLIGVYTLLLFSGGGALSLWKPEDRLIYRRMGERGRPTAGRQDAGGLEDEQHAAQQNTGRPTAGHPDERRAARYAGAKSDQPDEAHTGRRAETQGEQPGEMHTGRRAGDSAGLDAARVEVNR